MICGIKPAFKKLRESLNTRGIVNLGAGLPEIYCVKTFHETSTNLFSDGYLFWFDSSISTDHRRSEHIGGVQDVILLLRLVIRHRYQAECHHELVFDKREVLLDRGVFVEEFNR